MSFFSESTTKYSKEQENENNFHCLSCGSSLTMAYITEHKQMLVCSNKNVTLFN